MTVLSCGIFDLSISFLDEIRASVETSHGEICSKLLVLSFPPFSRNLSFLSSILDDVFFPLPVFGAL